jgi:hypothetical protein
LLRNLSNLLLDHRGHALDAPPQGLLIIGSSVLWLERGVDADPMSLTAGLPTDEGR